MSTPLTPEQATRIARHHLGDRYHWVGKGGPHGDDWIVQAVPAAGYMLHATAPTVEAAARALAQRLWSEEGWVPTHPRLEWGMVARKPGRHVLAYRHEALHVPLWEVEPTEDGAWCAVDLRHPIVIVDAHAAIQGAIAEWCARTLPSLHLPPFPGDSR
jgi:hypothetical protein